MMGTSPSFASAGALLTLAILLKAALILGAACLLAWITRRGSAALRHSIWAVGLAGAVSVPLLSQWLPALDLGLDLSLPGATQFAPRGQLSPLAASEPTVTAPAAVAPLPVQAETESSTLAASDAAPGPVRTGKVGVTWLAILLGVWLTGALGRLWWFGNQLRRVRWLSGHTPPEVDGPVVRLAEQIAQDLGIRRPVCVLQSSWASMPLTWGTLRPIILLPEEASEWPQERLRVVLLHELCHVRRWDYLVYVVAEIACALYWPLPLVWLARARVQQEQEQACDDLVLASGATPVDYAEHLLAVARSFYGNRWELGATVTMAREISLKNRIRAILDARTNRRPALSGHGLLLILVLSGFALPVAALRPTPAEVEPTPDLPAADATDPVAPAASPTPVSEPEVVDEQQLVAATWLWIEGEDGEVVGPMEIREDLAASSGGYVFVPDGDGNDAPEGGPGKVAFAFEVPAEGEYYLWGRAIGANENDNSFLVSIDDRAEIRWNIESGDGELLRSWGWVPLRDPESRQKASMPVRLTAGEHTLGIRNREDGTRLDRLLITGDPTYVPTGRGGAGPGHQPIYRWMEVEQARLMGSIEAAEHAGASGGRSIVFQRGNASEPSGSATFAFDVEAPGRYVVWGRVLAPDGGANSFYASLDAGEEVIWDAPRNLTNRQGRWSWVPLNARDYNGRTVDPLLLDLQPGVHTLRLRTREPKVELDGVLVTNDVGFRPRGLWPSALPANPVTIWLEAESALLDAPLLVRSDAEAAGGLYLQVEDGEARLAPPGADSRGSALLNFTVTEAGIYNFWARTRAHNGSENSFWVRVNEGVWMRWNQFPKDGNWRWSMVHDESRGGEIAQFNLRPGMNSIEFAAREGGARIDQIMITNDPLADPDAGARR